MLSSNDLTTQLDAAHEALTATEARLQEIAAREDAALNGSDKSYASWLREQRLAQNEAKSLGDRIDDLAILIERAREREEIAAYDEAYRAAAARADALIEHWKTEFPKVWRQFADLLRAVAMADIERARLERTKPHGYRPERRIPDVTEHTRSRGPLEKQVIDEKIVNLWCFPGTFDPVPQQDAVQIEGGRAYLPADYGHGRLALQQRRFRQTVFHPWAPALNRGPFWKDLVIPAPDHRVGPLFEGGLYMTPGSLLEALDSAERPHEEVRPIMTELEALDRPAARPSYQDTGPAISDHALGGLAQQVGAITQDMARRVPAE